MAYDSIEVIAGILIIITLIKLVVILVNKDKWLAVTEAFCGKGSRGKSWIVLVLAAIVFYYLIQVFTIVEILAVTTFVALLIAFGFMQFADDFMPMVRKMYKKDFWSGGILLYILLWLALVLWAGYELVF